MSARQQITNSEDVIDSRDVIERVQYLRDARVNESGRWIGSDEEESEFLALEALAAEGSDYSEDWEYGATLIRDSYFEDYARELAENEGAIPSEHTWPTSCIDWEQAARELRMDYTSVDFDGVTYWVR